MGPTNSQASLTPLHSPIVFKGVGSLLWREIGQPGMDKGLRSWLRPLFWVLLVLVFIRNWKSQGSTLFLLCAFAFLFSNYDPQQAFSILFLPFWWFEWWILFLTGLHSWYVSDFSDPSHLRAYPSANGQSFYFLPPNVGVVIQGWLMSFHLTH